MFTLNTNTLHWTSNPPKPFQNLVQFITAYIYASCANTNIVNEVEPRMCFYQTLNSHPVIKPATHVTNVSKEITMYYLFPCCLFLCIYSLEDINNDSWIRHIRAIQWQLLVAVSNKHSLSVSMSTMETNTNSSSGNLVIVVRNNWTDVMAWTIEFNCQSFALRFPVSSIRHCTYYFFTAHYCCYYLRVTIQGWCLFRSKTHRNQQRTY